MPYVKLIGNAEPAHREFILDLYNESTKSKQERIDRRILEIKRGLSRAKSNQILNFWLRSGMVEGDQFGTVWLTELGKNALSSYETQAN
jgi:hypothetical protein